MDAQETIFLTVNLWTVWRDLLVLWPWASQLITESKDKSEDEGPW